MSDIQPVEASPRNSAGQLIRPSLWAEHRKVNVSIRCEIFAMPFLSSENLKRPSLDIESVIMTSNAHLSPRRAVTS